MEEVDKIIIDSLRNLQCDLDEDITGLKQFDPDMIVNAISHCLETINPSASYPHKLPSSMSQRLKLATNLVEQIQELGFKGDVGYQSILYCNEIEIRRVLMYLIERLPRESGKTAIAEEIGYVPRLVKEIEARLKLSLHKPWIPSDLLYFGGRDCGEVFLRQSFGDSCPLNVDVLSVPRTQEDVSEGLRQYWARDLRDVTKQCATDRLIPSLLFDGCRFGREHNFGDVQAPVLSVESVLRSPVVRECVQPEENVETEVVHVSETDKLLDDVEQKTAAVLSLQNEIVNLDRKIQELKITQTELDDSVKQMEEKIMVRSKTYTVLSNAENMEKLNKLIENRKKRLVDLTEQWNVLQAPVLEQYRNLRNSLSAEELKTRQETEKLDRLRETTRQLRTDLKDKEILEQNLKEKCSKLPKNANRSVYTNRILEIIANIRKQNEEIQKILKDTKVVQKEINTLNGQVERSFTLCDELIFRDAKKDETARKAYKLLAALHGRYEEIINDVTEFGLLERESRNLQEQVDAEAAKEISKRLERVLADIEQVKTESAAFVSK